MAKTIRAIIFDFWGVLYLPTTQQLNSAVSSYLRQLQQQGIQCAIASSSSHHLISEFLQTHRLADYFSVIVGQEDVQQIKPNPKCYLTAAQQLGYTPERCLVIDDTVACISAAQQAGFQTILYRQNHTIFDTIAKYLHS